MYEGSLKGGSTAAYLSGGKSGSGSHFQDDSSYRGSMHVGRPATATEVGNQPQMSKESSLESRANKESSIPKA